MAVGDAVATVSASVADDGYQAIQPGSGVEWIIHNISAPNGTEWELARYDGTTSIALGTFRGPLLGMVFHLTNSVYLRIRNVSGAAAYYSWDGVVSK